MIFDPCPRIHPFEYRRDEIPEKALWPCSGMQFWAISPGNSAVLRVTGDVGKITG